MKLPFFKKKTADAAQRETIERKLYAIRGGGAEGKNTKDVCEVVKEIADADSG